MSPELPEVETFKNYFDSTSLNQKIKDVIVRDNRVLNIEENIFKKRLISNTFYSTLRHGKHLFAKLNSGFIMFHFGMSGDLKYFMNTFQSPSVSNGDLGGGGFRLPRVSLSLNER